MLLTQILFIAPLLCGCLAASFYDYGSNEDDISTEQCDATRCLLPDCSCFGTEPPKGFQPKQVPQFVTLTFDDAINVENAKTYRIIQKGRKNRGNGCQIAMTFFACHEYNDYHISNEMYKRGNELGVHSITHKSNTDEWKAMPYQEWKDEMAGMRQVMSKFGGIPESSIVGHRAPFLQTAGNVTFSMLRENGFKYDSSLPTRSYMKPPLWPYTLDFGYPQDCQIRPCPKGSFPGLWVFPMVQYKRQATDKEGKSTTFHCSMADACTPYPETSADTKQYLMENFERHYLSNRAPFPLYLHEAWLKEEKRLKGYLEFLDEILTRDDVFVVTIQEVLSYMQHPVTLEQYKTKGCFAKDRPAAGRCDEPKNCNFPKRSRFMKSCIPCPKRYPWIGNPYGDVIKKP